MPAPSAAAPPSWSRIATILSPNTGCRLPSTCAIPFAPDHYYELPFGDRHRFAQKGAGAAVFGNWRLSGNIAAHSGTPFTALALPTGTSIRRRRRLRGALRPALQSQSFSGSALCPGISSTPLVSSRRPPNSATPPHNLHRRPGHVHLEPPDRQVVPLRRRPQPPRGSALGDHQSHQHPKLRGAFHHRRLAQPYRRSARRWRHADHGHHSRCELDDYNDDYETGSKISGTPQATPRRSPSPLCWPPAASRRIRSSPRPRAARRQNTGSAELAKSTIHPPLNSWKWTWKSPAMMASPSRHSQPEPVLGIRRRQGTEALDLRVQRRRAH